MYYVHKRKDNVEIGRELRPFNVYASITEDTAAEMVGNGRGDEVLVVDENGVEYGDVSLPDGQVGCILRYGDSTPKQYRIIVPPLLPSGREVEITRDGQEPEDTEKFRFLVFMPYAPTEHTGRRRKRRYNYNASSAGYAIWIERVRMEIEKTKEEQAVSQNALRSEAVIAATAFCKAAADAVSKLNRWADDLPGVSINYDRSHVMEELDSGPGLARTVDRYETRLTRYTYLAKGIGGPELPGLLRKAAALLPDALPIALRYGELRNGSAKLVPKGIPISDETLLRVWVCRDKSSKPTLKGLQLAHYLEVLYTPSEGKAAPKLAYKLEPAEKPPFQFLPSACKLFETHVRKGVEGAEVKNWPFNVAAMDRAAAAAKAKRDALKEVPKVHPETSNAAV